MAKLSRGRAGGKHSAPPAGRKVLAYEAAHTFHGYRIADLRRILLAVTDARDWRAPWKADVDRLDVPRLRAAVRYYHGDEPVVIRTRAHRVTMAGHGLQAGPPGGK